MKRLPVVIACLLACLVAFLACTKEPKPVEPDTVPVQTVSISLSSNEMNVDDMAKLTVTITPSNATNQGLSFSSSDPNVVEVDSQGNLWAHKAGTVTITVTTRDGGKTATVTVIVKAPGPVVVSGVKLDQTSLTMTVDDEVTLVATVEPSDADNKKVIWESSDMSVATVDANGKVKALKAGSSTITVKTDDGGKTATCTVTVNEKPVPVTGIEYVGIDGLKFHLGEDIIARVRVLPDNATNKKYTWNESDIFTVSEVEEGSEFDILHIKGLKAGKATLTLTTDDGGYTASIGIEVEEFIEITSMTVSPASLNMKVNETAELTAIVEPDNATAGTVLWKSDPVGIVNVTMTGLRTAQVKAISVGTTTVIGTSADGKKQVTCKVTVTEPTTSVSGLSLDRSNMEIVKGKNATLTATVQPSDATNKKVTWGSSNKSVATVDSNGKITAKAEGTATITAKTDDGNYSASCEVTVIKAPVLQLQIARAYDAYGQWDFTDTFELAYTFQNYYIRLYDTANDRVVDGGTFDYSDLYKTRYMDKAEGSSSQPGVDFKVYGHTWNLVLRADGYIQVTLSYKNDDWGVDFSRRVTIQYPRPLELHWEGLEWEIHPEDEAVRVQAGKETSMIVMHKTKERMEYLKPEYLSFTGGDSSIAELRLHSSGAYIYAVGKKAGTTTWTVKYYENGITMDRKVIVRVYNP